MSIVADQYTHVIGVDTHARTHTYAVIETATGKLVAVDAFPTTPPGLDRAITWIRRRATGPVVAAVEGASSYGATLTAALQAQEIPVADTTPPLRSARTGRGKSDPIDAEAAARSVLGQDTSRLTRPRAGKPRSALRVLLTARRQMDIQRTADRNALTALLRMIDLGVDARKPLTDKQITSIAAWRHHTGDDIEQATARQEATRLARAVIALTAQIRQNRDSLEAQASQLAPKLLQL
ncbi:IS110 family transposase, partial [Humibacter antri]